MGKTLKTNPSVWTKVFRRLCAQAANDPGFRGVFGDRFRSWTGDDGSSDPLAPALGLPVVRFTPIPGNVDWYDPSSQAGTLTVVVELAVMTTAIDDVIDAWDTIVSALKPGDPKFTLALVALGSETGEIVFTDPAYDSKPASDPKGLFLASGRFRLQVLRSILS